MRNFVYHVDAMQEKLELMLLYENSSGSNAPMNTSHFAPAWVRSIV